MGRLFLVLFAIFSALFVLRYIVRALYKLPSSSKTQSPEDGGDMVQCAHCGTYTPKQHAFEKNGQLYCSAEHRDQQSGDQQNGDQQSGDDQS